MEPPALLLELRSGEEPVSVSSALSSLGRGRGRGEEGGRGRDILEVGPLAVVEDVEERIDVKLGEQRRVRKLSRGLLRVVAGRDERLTGHVVLWPNHTLMSTCSTQGERRRRTSPHREAEERTRSPRRGSHASSPNRSPSSSLRPNSSAPQPTPVEERATHTSVSHSQSSSPNPRDCSASAVRSVRAQRAAGGLAARARMLGTRWAQARERRRRRGGRRRWGPERGREGRGRRERGLRGRPG